MNKQLSPMEQLIEWLKTEESFITDADGREDRIARQAYRNVIAKATELLTSSSKVVEDDNLLKEANDILRSCYSVIERKGADTNWEPLGRAVKKALENQHRAMYPKMYPEQAEMKNTGLSEDCQSKDDGFCNLPLGSCKQCLPESI